MALYCGNVPVTLAMAWVLPEVTVALVSTV